MWINNNVFRIQYTMHRGYQYTFFRRGQNKHLFSIFTSMVCGVYINNQRYQSVCDAAYVQCTIRWNEKEFFLGQHHTLLCSTSGYVIFNFIFAFIFFVLVVGGLRWQIFLHWPTASLSNAGTHRFTSNEYIFLETFAFDGWIVERCSWIFSISNQT